MNKYLPSADEIRNYRTKTGMGLMEAKRHLTLSNLHHAVFNDRQDALKEAVLYLLSEEFNKGL